MAPNQSRLVLLAALFLVAAVGQVRCESLGNVIAIINGTVPCSTGSNINVASALPFPNATVQLVCGTATVASARTGSTGIVSFILGPIANLPTTLLVNLLTGQGGGGHPAGRLQRVPQRRHRDAELVGAAPERHPAAWS
ncbi:unnamed protein product [Urochloa humidicola]